MAFDERRWHLHDLCVITFAKVEGSDSLLARLSTFSDSNTELNELSSCEQVPAIAPGNVTPDGWEKVLAGLAGIAAIVKGIEVLRAGETNVAAIRDQRKARGAKRDAASLLRHGRAIEARLVVTPVVAYLKATGSAPRTCGMIDA